MSDAWGCFSSTPPLTLSLPAPSPNSAEAELMGGRRLQDTPQKVAEGSDWSESAPPGEGAGENPSSLHHARAALHLGQAYLRTISCLIPEKGDVVKDTVELIKKFLTSPSLQSAQRFLNLYPVPGARGGGRCEMQAASLAICNSFFN